MGWKNKIVFDIDEALAENDTIGSFVLDPTGTLIDPRDIRALTNVDVVTVEQGTSPWVIGDGGGAITVDAVDLDIRDLDAATDNVAAWTNDGAGTPITSTVVGPATGLDVNILNSLTVDVNGVYDISTNPTPDSVGAIVHTRAAAPDETNQTFRTTGAAASSDAVTAANVQGIDVNAFGMAYNGTTWDRNRSRNNELLVNDTANIAILQTQKTVTSTTGALLASQLANRKYLLIQNNGSGTIYLGAAGVTTADGFPISGNSVAELRCGPAVSVHAVTNTGNRDARLLELS